MKHLSLLLALGMAMASTVALADTASHTTASTPPRLAAAYASDGQYIYVFGGFLQATGNLDPSLLTGTIFRFDPAMDSLVQMGATLPTPRARMATFYDGQYIYLIGGYDGVYSKSSGISNEILRYNPATDTIEQFGTMSVYLTAASAIWTGNVAYIIGGSARYYNPDDNTWYVVGNHVMRYVPGGQMELMNAQFPQQPPLSATAVWGDGVAYVLGGTYLGSTSNIIWVYNPSTDSITNSQAKLQGGVVSPPAIWDGQRIFVLGGGHFQHQSPVATIVRYDPLTNDVHTMSEKLPQPRGDSVVAWVYNPTLQAPRAYVLFGLTPSGPADKVVEYTPGPAAPIGPAASPNPQGGIQLVWAPPPPLGLSPGQPGIHFELPVDGYRIYRGTNTNPLTPVADLPNTLTWVDEDVQPGVLYLYRISAFNSAGEGSLSPAVVASTALPL